MEEIKAGDIMIGNYIRDIWSDNGFFKVTEIRKDKVYYGNCFKAKYEDLRPIPLTEDILLKSGFGKRDDKCFLIIPTGVGLHSIYFEVEFEYERILFIMWIGKETENTKKVIFNIKYLHQLQNLFKSLTGNDLKIKIEV